MTELEPLLRQWNRAAHIKYKPYCCCCVPQSGLLPTFIVTGNQETEGKVFS